jgi:hypothetical protein
MRYNAATIDGAPIKRTRIAVPAGFDSHDEFLDDMRENYSVGFGFDEHNVSAGREDAEFVVGKQWDERVEQRRKDKQKPVLTTNRMIAFIAQILGNRLMNETEIRVHPDKDGTKEIARIRQGIIRSIYKNSLADLARDEAHKYQVIGGQGVFCLSIDYTSDDVFEQKISLKPLADPYAAVFDPSGIDPTGGDCEWVFVGEDIPTKEYTKRWPHASKTSFEGNWDRDGYWQDQDTVRIVYYWRMVTEGYKTLALLKDGTTQDVTDIEEFEYLPFVELRSDGTPYIREIPNRFARLYICSGNEILEGPYDYPISSLPVYRVPGWEVNDGQKLHRWGLIRFLKDPQRLHNYWRSVLAEQLIAAPRNKWLTTPDAVKGHEKRWRASPSSDDPFLYYNDGETVPQHIPPPGMDGALINEAGMAAQDMKDISNIHEASLGMPSNEVSRVAIQQRQQVSDVGSYIYVDRLRLADERCARNINELIPHIYDTKRIEVIEGQDGKLEPVDLNSSEATDVTLGKYGITVTVGPATATKRQLAAESMMAFVNAVPQEASKVMDLVAESQDWPKADEFARRFRLGLPDGFIAEEDLTDEQKAARKAQSQMAQMQQQLEMKNAELELAIKEAKAANDTARAELAKAQAFKAISDARARMMDVEGKIDQKEFERIMQMLDQHNSLESEDRDFDERSALQMTRQTENTSNANG